MRFVTSVVRAALAAAALASPLAAASAQNVTFTGAGNFATAPSLVPGLGAGAFTFTFTLPQSPTPAIPNPVDGSAFTVNGVDATFTQGATSTTLANMFAAFTTANSGGFLLGTSQTQILLSPFTAQQVFTGTADAPTFVVGSYAVTDNDVAAQGTVTGAFTVSPAAASTVPEPSTVALVAAGAAGLAAVARRRRRATLR